MTHATRTRDRDREIEHCAAFVHTAVVFFCVMTRFACKEEEEEEGGLEAASNHA